MQKVRAIVGQPLQSSPLLLGKNSVSPSFNLTQDLALEYKDFMMLMNFPSAVLWFTNFCQSNTCDTLSNAFLKSTKQTWGFFVTLTV